MAYTKENVETWKTEYSNTKKQVRKFSIPAYIMLFAAFVFLLYFRGRVDAIFETTYWGIQGKVYYLAFVITSMGLAMYSRTLWKCPNCGRNFGKAINFNHCPHCGVPLDGQQKNTH